MKLSVKQFGLFLMFTYMVSYITRINFGAVIAEMVVSTGFSKSELSMSVTGAFITYGIGQIVTGWLGDRFQPKNLLMLGLAVTTLTNLILPFCPNPWVMMGIWCVNGFAQAFMWPPMVRLLANLLNEEEYKRTTLIVTWGGSIGTIVIYLVSSLFVTVADWRFVFWFASLCGAVMMPIWYSLCPTLSREAPAAKAEKATDAPVASRKGLVVLMLSPLMIGIMISIILQGSLRDGITTWMPTFISETYELGSSIAILTGVLLPLFSILCSKITEYVYEKRLKNPLTCSAVVFGIGALSALLLFFLNGVNAAASVGLTALLTGCMHGVNLVLICMVPAFFRNSGHISLISGILNTCTYVGSALSTYGITLLTDNFGWTVTVGVWFAFAAAGTAICLLLIPAWRKRFGK